MDVHDFIDIELTEVENELYDRQIRLWGLDSQKRLRAAKILVSGMSGVGAEVTKNIILSGVHSVKLHDEKVVTEEDFCSQFLLSRNSTGINRATASIDRARKLNPMVEISADTDPLEEKEDGFFFQFDIILVTGAQERELIRIDNICRLRNINFFCGDVWGMFGYCCAELQNHKFFEDLVKHKVISTLNQKTKTELITTTTQKVLKFPSLQDVFNFNYNSQAFLRKKKNTGSAFILLRILYKFREHFKRNPLYKSRDEDIVRLENIRNEYCNDNVVPSSLFLNVFGQISPSVAVVGGVLAQEIIKVILKKGTPISNIFLFDPESVCGYIEHITADMKYK